MVLIDSTDATPAGPPAVWYRVEDQTYAPPLDEFENVCGPSTRELKIRRYEVVKTTPKGVWLIVGYSSFASTPDGKRFVLLSSRKRFACSTLEEALESYIERKRRQHGIMTARANAAAEFKRMAERRLAKLRGQLSQMDTYDVFNR